MLTTCRRRPTRFLLLGLLSILLPREAVAQRLLRDIQTAIPQINTGGWDRDAVVAGGLAYFVAQTTAFGEELWVTDGTSANTRLLKDLDPGRRSSRPDELTPLGEGVVFLADTVAGGRRLYVSDGTPAGTQLLETFQAPQVTTFAGNLTPFRGEVYLTAQTLPPNGWPVWRTDGTPGGTSILPGFPVATHFRPRNLVVSGGWLYFTAEERSRAVSLWRTDGTAQGTSQVYAFQSNFPPSRLTAFRGGVMMRFSGGGGGNEPWFFEGGILTQLEVQPGAFGSSPEDFVDLGSGRMVFTAETTGEGRELWVTDGTAAGTRILADIQPGPEDSDIDDLFGFGNLAVFAANDGTRGTEVWVTDGTPVGTFMLADLRPGPASSEPSNFIVVDGQVWFQARDAQRGRELFVTDGSPSGTFLLADAYGSAEAIPVPVVAFGDGALGGALHPVAGYEPHLLRARGDESTMLVDALEQNEGSHPERFVALGDLVLFTADDGFSGREWYASAPLSTFQVRNIGAGPASSEVESAAVAGSHLYFNAVDSSGDRLWRTDGTSVGTQPVVAGAGAPDRPRGITTLGSRVVFEGRDGSHGREPWTSDGTSSGTVLLKDVRPGPDGADMGPIQAAGNLAYFAADDGATGRELWVTDGSGVGTVRIADLFSGSGGSNPTELTPALGRLFFVAEDGRSGREVWQVDAGAGTGPSVLDLVGGPAGSDPEHLVEAAGRLFFTARASSEGREWWSSDGSVAGTRRLADLAAGGKDLVVVDAVGIRTGLFFIADAGDGLGRELWFSDGTAVGTARMRDIFPGASSGPVAGTLTAVLDASAVVFAAQERGAARQLWYSAGTAATTQPLTGSGTAGFGATSIHGIFADGRKVYFAMDDLQIGSEPYSLDLAAAIGADGFAVPFGEGCSAGGAAPRIGATGRPLLGRQDFAVTLEVASPTTAFLFLGFAEAETTISGTCRRYLQAPVATARMVMGAGLLSSGFAVPNDPALLGLDAFFQWAGFGSGGAHLGQVDLSDALHVRVGG